MQHATHLHYHSKKMTRVPQLRTNCKNVIRDDTELTKFIKDILSINHVCCQRLKSKYKRFCVYFFPFNYFAHLQIIACPPLIRIWVTHKPTSMEEISVRWCQDRMTFLSKQRCIQQKPHNYFCNIIGQRQMAFDMTWLSRFALCVIL